MTAEWFETVKAELLAHNPFRESEYFRRFADGSLTRVDSDAGGLCFAGGGTANLTSIDPTGRHLYTSDYTTLNAVGAYAIDATTGALSAPPKFPWPLPPYSGASLLRISSQRPAVGTPRR